MSREIKFRVWNPNANKFVAYAGVNEMPLHEAGAITLKVPVYEILQYTGLKDKNGVEIYEGDVIRAKHDDGRYDIGNIVYGSKGAFCLHLPNVATGIKTPLLNYIHGIMFAESDFEVIGNIYEHGNLLEANQ